MRTNGQNGINAFGFAHNPYAVRVLEAFTHLANLIFLRETCRKNRGWFEQNTWIHEPQKSQQSHVYRTNEAEPGDSTKEFASCPEVALICFGDDLTLRNRETVHSKNLKLNGGLLPAFDAQPHSEYKT